MAYNDDEDDFILPFDLTTEDEDEEAVTVADGIPGEFDGMGYSLANTFGEPQPPEALSFGDDDEADLVAQIINSTDSDDDAFSGGVADSDDFGYTGGIDFGLEDETDSVGKSKSAPSAPSPIRRLSFIALGIVLAGVVVLGVLKMFGGGDESPTPPQAGGSSSTSQSDSPDPSTSFPTATRTANGPGSLDTPIDSIKGYMNAMYVNHNVDEIFKYLDPNTSYTKGETEKTVADLKKQYAKPKLSMSITQKEKGSFNWLVNTTITHGVADRRDDIFDQSIIMIEIDGKWYVNRIKNLT